MPIYCISCGFESVSNTVLYGPYGICANCEAYAEEKAEAEWNSYSEGLAYSEAHMFDREYEEEALGRPLFPNEY